MCNRRQGGTNFETVEDYIRLRKLINIGGGDNRDLHTANIRLKIMRKEFSQTRLRLVKHASTPKEKCLTSVCWFRIIKQNINSELPAKAWSDQILVTQEDTERGPIAYVKMKDALEKVKWWQSGCVARRDDDRWTKAMLQWTPRDVKRPVWKSPDYCDCNTFSKQQERDTES